MPSRIITHSHFSRTIPLTPSIGPAADITMRLTLIALPFTHSSSRASCMERNHMMVKDENYQGHPVFSDLVRYEAFYKSLASSVFQWVSLGTRSLGNIDSYVFSSIEGTLASI